MVRLIGAEIDIQFLYFRGCPNSAPTLQNLLQAVGDLGLAARPVETEVDPETFKGPFSGSPSVLVNGVDLYTRQVPSTFEFSCRTFEINGVRTGVLPADFIRERLTAILQIDL